MSSQGTQSRDEIFEDSSSKKKEEVKKRKVLSNIHGICPEEMFSYLGTKERGKMKVRVLAYDRIVFLSWCFTPF